MNATPDPITATAAFVAADGQDNSWKSEGRCRPHWSLMDPDDARGGMLHLVRHRWWTVNRSDRVSVPDGDKTVTVSPTAMRRMALLLCQVCPVQWDCVRFAIDVDADYTWAATDADREWLRTHVPEWREHVSRAEANGQPVQQMIADLKEQAA